MTRAPRAYAVPQHAARSKVREEDEPRLPDMTRWWLVQMHSQL